MGCIVNGPGEMADADFGYVGGAPGKIDLYVGKEVVKRGIPHGGACDALVQLIKVVPIVAFSRFAHCLHAVLDALRWSLSTCVFCIYITCADASSGLAIPLSQGRQSRAVQALDAAH